ncbi:MAG: 8-amino-7-oxononanoate synthase [Saprospiraceae bacterium]|nr:8-amino-7-oxononanoate synthase [Saprospiraceae bacterium]
MEPFEEYLRHRLAARKEENAFRSLQVNHHLIDFCSNDYLGLAQLPSEGVASLPRSTAWGATGSRLISGQTKVVASLESYLADFHGAEAALIYTSGYTANLGLLSCLTTRHDTIIYDQLIHASLREGIQLARAKSFNFRHNELDDLREKLDRASGRKLVVVESIYSMDGDAAPLTEMVAICQAAGAEMLVDEAHATGVCGVAGQGLVHALGLQDQIWARVHTFGKAIGAHGAAVVGSSLLRDYLINFSRSFIYTTALPDPLLARIQWAYLEMAQGERCHLLQNRITQFKEALDPGIAKHFIPSDSPIQCILVPGNEAAKEMAKTLQAAGFDIRAILSPTVPKGQERLRICLHTFNTKDQIHKLTELMNQIIPVHEERSIC